MSNISNISNTSYKYMKTINELDELMDNTIENEKQISEELGKQKKKIVNNTKKLDYINEKIEDNKNSIEKIKKKCILM